MNAVDPRSAASSRRRVDDHEIREPSGAWLTRGSARRPSRLPVAHRTSSATACRHAMFGIGGRRYAFAWISFTTP